MEKYLVIKQFAHDSEIFSKGDILELSSDVAEKYAKNLETYKETKNMEVDTKAISDAIREGLTAFAPKVDGNVQKSVSFGDYLKDLAKNPEVAKKTINVTTSTQGAATTTIFTDDPMSDILKSSMVTNMLPVINLDGTNNIYKFNVINSAGTAPAVVTEGNTINASQPTLSSFQVDLEKASYRFDVTDEAMQDTGALVQEILNVVPDAFAKFIENGVINGSSTCFDGIVGDANTASVAAVSGQTAGTINAENISTMYCAQKYPSKAVWIMGREAYCAIQGLEDANGNNLFVGPMGFADAPFGMLKGRPIVVSDYAQSIGTVGDIIFANLSAYKFVTKDGLKVRSSEHVSFITDVNVYKFTFRMGGRPGGIKWTATDGTVVSDFVTLATRS